MRSVRKPLVPALGDLERAVLEYLWREGEADVPTTHAELGPTRGIRPNTVGSALERLYRKRLVERRKVSHRYRYWAVIDRATFHSRLVLDAVDGGEALKDTGVLAAFVDAVGDIDEATLDDLARLIAKRREDA